MGCCTFDGDGKEDAELDQGYSSPQAAQRGCTDCICLIVFLACFSLLVGITCYAGIEGDMNRFKGLPDSQGVVCGVGPMMYKPLLYLCIEETSAPISLKAITRQCVLKCPGKGAKAPCGVAYGTDEFAGMICMPQKSATNALTEGLTTTLQKHPTFKVMMTMSEIPKAWKPILCSACLAIVLGFVFLLTLRTCTCLVWVGLFAVIIVSGLIGFSFLYSAVTGGADGVPGTGDAQWDFLISVCALVICAIFTCIVLCKRSSIEMAINCIKAAGECICDSPSLLLEPFVALAFRGLIMLVLLTGFLLVYTLKVDNVSLTAAGHNVRFSYPEYQKYIAAYYVFMILWILELCTAMSQFVVSYAVEMWFFSSYNSQVNSKSHPHLMCAAFEAYWIGMIHHLGTMAKGSFIIAVFRGFQMVMGTLVNSAEGTGHPVVACLGKICMCCIACFQKCLQHMNKTAYMDVALNGNSFCTAAYHAMKILSSNATGAAVLSGAAWIFELAGAAGITASGVGLTYWMLKTDPTYYDQESPSHIPEPVMVCVVSGVVCLILALPFVLVFGQAADTILFCFAVDKKRHPNGDMLEDATGAVGWFGSFFGGPTKEEINQKVGQKEIDHGPETQALLSMVRK